MNKLEKYARLLVEVGLNVQKGQTVIIAAPVECAAFARMCASAAYAVGCREVIMDWGDDYLARQKYLHAADEVFDEVPEWRKNFYNGYARQGAGFLRISASDPENLKGVDPGRLRRASIASGAALSEYRNAVTNNGTPWCIASVPIPSWAKRVFPDAKTEQEAMEKLWEKIFAAVRVEDETDPVQLWHEHIQRLSYYRDKLTEYNFKYLHYTNSLGTDLMVELPENHFWAAGSEISKGGIEFVANMPTEEIFSAPKFDGVNGKIVASMPLVKDGNIIDNFYMILKDGKIVEVHAEKGEEILKNAISIDEGASYLGEVALVPYDSPIQNSKTLFYSTLFDENAACHFAFGEAYPMVKGSDEMTPEEQKAHGLNISKTHVDFMIGTADLNIVGITHDGEKIPVFVNGNFAF